MNALVNTIRDNRVHELPRFRNKTDADHLSLHTTIKHSVEEKSFGWHCYSIKQMHDLVRRNLER